MIIIEKKKNVTSNKAGSSTVIALVIMSSLAKHASFAVPYATVQDTMMGIVWSDSIWIKQLRTSIHE